MIQQQKAACDAMTDEKDKLINDFQQVSSLAMQNTYMYAHIQKCCCSRQISCVVFSAFYSVHMSIATLILCLDTIIQELKAQDDQYVKYLKKQAEEVDLLQERMEEQARTLLRAHRQEMMQIENSFAAEREALSDSHK